MACSALYQAGSDSIILSNGNCQAEIYSWGCLLNSFSIAIRGEQVNVVDGFSSAEAARQHMLPLYKSAKLSPFVCNMNQGRYPFHNCVYQMERLSGHHAKHGLVYDKPFTPADIRSSENMAGVVLQYLYEGTDAGYPFPYTLTVTYELSNENCLRVITNILNRHHASIPVADGWHPYFHLGGQVDQLILQINSSARMDYDAELLPLPGLVDDKRFTAGYSLANVELDNGFLLQSKYPACVLSNAELSLTVDAVKNYSFLQLYTEPSRKSIAIEIISGAPDNFNNKIGLVELRAGEDINFEVAYTLQII